MSEPAVNEETAIQAEDKQSESIVFDPNADAAIVWFR